MNVELAKGEQVRLRRICLLQIERPASNMESAWGGSILIAVANSSHKNLAGWALPTATADT